MQSKPNSTYYNRPDIEYKALKTANNITLGLGPASDLPTNVDQYPTSRTTGNGLIFLTGNVMLNNGIVAADVIAILPPSRPQLAEGRYVASIRGASTGTPIVVHLVDGEIRATDAIALGETIDFDGIVYLQDFPV